MDHHYSFHTCDVKPIQPLNILGPSVPSPSQSQLPSHLSTATSRGRPGPCPITGTRPVSRALPSAIPQQSREADYHSTYGFPNPPRHTLLTFPWHNFRNSRVIPPKHQDLWLRKGISQNASWESDKKSIRGWVQCVLWL